MCVCVCVCVVNHAFLRPTFVFSDLRTAEGHLLPENLFIWKNRPLSPAKSVESRSTPPASDPSPAAWHFDTSCAPVARATETEESLGDKLGGSRAHSLQ